MHFFEAGRDESWVRSEPESPIGEPEATEGRIRIDSENGY